MMVALDAFWKSKIRISNSLAQREWSNALTNKGLGVMMSALVGIPSARITHLYLRFGTDANPGVLGSINDGLQTTLRSHFLDTTVSGTGGIWVPILSAPIHSSTDVAKYGNNKATFLFRIPAALEAGQITGTFDIATSKIGAMGLASAQSADDRTQDVMVTAAQAAIDPVDGIFSPFLLDSSGQTAVDYEVSLQEPAA